MWAHSECVVGYSSGADVQAFRLDSDTVVHRRCNPLGAAEIALCGLHGDVPKKKLNLLQLAAGGTAEASATSTEIVGRKFADADLAGELLDDMPDELFRYSFAPNSTCATHPPEKATRANSGRRCPVIQQAMHPIRDGNGSNVTTLSPQVHDCPMPFALLKVAQGQLASSCRRSPQASSRASSARSRLPLICSGLGACQSACPCSAVNQLPSLTPSFFTPLTRRIPAAKSALRRPQSDASYASRRTAPRRRLMVPGARLRFQMQSVPDDHRFAERQSWLGAVPLHEFVYGMPIAALGIGT